MKRLIGYNNLESRGNEQKMSIRLLYFSSKKNIAYISKTLIRINRKLLYEIANFLWTSYSIFLYEIATFSLDKL